MSNQPIGNHGLGFFDVIRFDLWPLFQGQMRIDFTLGFSKVKHVLMAVVSFLVDTICIGSPMR